MGESRDVKLADALALPKEYPVLERLGKFVITDPSTDTGEFVPVTAGSIGVSNSTTANNVYVISHGWMPDYRDWADGYLAVACCLCRGIPGQGPIKAALPSTTWLYTKGETEDTYLSDQPFTINETGLAQEILKVDPNATVLAYSWIDESGDAEPLHRLPVRGVHDDERYANG